METPPVEEVKNIAMPQMPTEVIANEPTATDPNLFNLNTETAEPVLENPVANLSQMEESNKIEPTITDTPIATEIAVSEGTLPKEETPVESSGTLATEPAVPNVPDASSLNDEVSIEPEKTIEEPLTKVEPVLEETTIESIPSAPAIDDQIPALEAVENPLENKGIISSNQTVEEVPAISAIDTSAAPVVDSKETVGETVSTDNVIPSTDPTPIAVSENDLVADTPFTVPTDPIVQTKPEEEKTEVIEKEPEPVIVSEPVVQEDKSEPIIASETVVQETELQNNDDINKQFSELKDNINKILDDFENRLLEKKSIDDKSEVVEELQKFEIPMPDINESVDVEIPNINTELPKITEEPVVPNVMEQPKEEVIPPVVSQTIEEPSEQLISGTKFGF